jgi:hypothetical protein
MSVQLIHLLSSIRAVQTTYTYGRGKRSGVPSESVVADVNAVVNVVTNHDQNNSLVIDQVLTDEPGLDVNDVCPGERATLIGLNPIPVQQ